MNLFPRFYNKSLEQITKEFNSKNIRFLTFAKLDNRIVNKTIDLNKCVLIIDEVHNLFRPLPNQKKQHEHLEKLLLSNKYPNLNVFILTATLGDNPNEIMKLLKWVLLCETGNWLELLGWIGFDRNNYSLSNIGTISNRNVITSVNNYDV